MFRGLFKNSEVCVLIDCEKNMFSIERVNDRENNPAVVIALAPGEITITCERGTFVQGTKDDRPAVFVQGKRRAKAKKG